MTKYGIMEGPGGERKEDVVAAAILGEIVGCDVLDVRAGLLVRVCEKQLNV